MSNIPRRLQQNGKKVLPSDKKYYFLASGTIFFFPVGKPEDVCSMPVNGVFTTQNGTIPVSGIANAQRVLQQQAADRAASSGMAEINIVDVQLISISKLGHMSPEEFHDLDGGEQIGTEVEAQ